MNAVQSPLDCRRVRRSPGTLVDVHRDPSSDKWPRSLNEDELIVKVRRAGLWIDDVVAATAYTGLMIADP